MKNGYLQENNGRPIASLFFFFHKIDCNRTELKSNTCDNEYLCII